MLVSVEFRPGRGTASYPGVGIWKPKASACSWQQRGVTPPPQHCPGDSFQFGLTGPLTTKAAATMNSSGVSSSKIESGVGPL